MCYRFAYGDVEKALKKYRVQLNDDALTKLGDPFNVYPTDFAPVISFTSGNSNEIQADAMKWGLVPAWASDSKIGRKLFNARMETINEKPAFKYSYQNMRCIVPVVGFYEVDRRGEKPRSAIFTTKGNSGFSLAGIFSIWKDVKYFTILTKQADSNVMAIHDRMPVILPGSEFETTWLKDGSKLGVLHDIVVSNQIRLTYNYEQI